MFKTMTDLMFLPLEMMQSTLSLFAGKSATPIASLKTPEPVMIRGRIVEVDGEELVLRDHSGQIVVDLDYINVKTAKFKVGETISVVGYLDIDRDFDCYEIHRLDGSVIKAVVS